jgi:hypothetical protein
VEIMFHENDVDHVVSMSRKICRDLPSLKDIQHTIQPVQYLKDDSVHQYHGSKSTRLHGGDLGIFYDVFFLQLMYYENDVCKDIGL